MKRTWIIIVFLILLTIVLYFVSKTNASQCNSNNPDNCPLPSPICDNGEHTNNPHCHPTSTPTPTLKATCTPTPTIKICNEDHPCVTPTSTPTPTAGQSATPTPTSVLAPQASSTGSDGSSQPPPPAICNTPFDKPVIVSFTAKGNGIVNFAWIENQGSINKYSIIYGYSPNSLIYGEDNIPSTSWNIDIGNLKPGNSVYAQVWAWMGKCAEMSNIFDPHVL